jgi:hypothetical protein
MDSWGSWSFPSSLVAGEPIEASGVGRDARAKVLAAGNVDRLDCPFLGRVSGAGRACGTLSLSDIER